ncbi:ISAs1 family transposase [Synechococcales cyanobacterium C]|uniref:ISAs1 family transposase n=1 Tax=Petrachloros mirabilis ULC683 TaxID=2781853 RepID=A0A8K2A6Y7_9CYAN|nr:ISAs1 family transposase [Petrachloros mirabilis]NCJ05679.1 ISAs1 family transposase [Petrachloros mirabilis ULC683]
MRYILKKTLEQIISSGNNYLVAVKANQPKLFNEIARQFEQAPILSVQTETEKTRTRQTQRSVMIINTVEGIDSDWVGVERFIRVQRSDTRDNEPYDQTVFYMSSLSFDAGGFAEYIRAHWQIENCLH